PGVCRGRVRMARVQMFDVLLRGWRKLRLSTARDQFHQPQLREPAESGNTNPSRIARDRGGIGRRRRHRGSAGAALMAGFTTLTAVALPLLRNNVDTDAIIPSREMKTVGKSGLADGLFAGWRYRSVGSRDPDPGFVLNDPRYREA